MTTEEKNVEIALMLGGEYKRNEKLSFEPKGRWYITKFPDVLQNYNLKFHSDANWQFEALGHIYKKGYDWSIKSGNYCNINNPEGEEIISINIDPKEGNAVFEALYEISKILK